MPDWGKPLPQRKSQHRAGVAALAVLTLLGTATLRASAQVLYDSLSQPITNNTGQTQVNRFGPGVQYTLNYGSAAVDAGTGRVVTPLMADDIHIQADSGGFAISDISFSVFNQVRDNQTVTVNGNPVNLGASGQMTVKPYLTIWAPDGLTPEVHSPVRPNALAFPDANNVTPGYQPSNDSPGTKMFRVALPEVTLDAATLDAGSNTTIPSSAIVHVGSDILNGLTLPFVGGSHYWFGLTFDQARDTANLTETQQTQRMARIALGLYNPAIGTSGDVHFETFDQTVWPPNDPSYPAPYKGAGGPGYYDENNVWEKGYYTNFHNIYGPDNFNPSLNDPNAVSNFGWLINGVINVPEPTGGAFVLLGLPFARVLLRRCHRK